MAGKIIDFNHFKPFVFFYCTYCNNRSLGKSLLSRNRNIKKKKKLIFHFTMTTFLQLSKEWKLVWKSYFRKLTFYQLNIKLVGLVNYQTWGLCSCFKISRLISIKLAFNWIGIWMEYGVLINKLNFPIEMHRRPLFNPF